MKEFVTEETKTDRAYRLIKAMILSGEIRADTMLSEHAMAKRLSMSRTPVRAAVLRLTHEGLFKSYSRKGTLLRDISVIDAGEIFEFRMAIEEFVIAHVQPRLTSVYWDRIDQYMAQMEQACQNVDLITYLSIDAKFHDCLAEAYGNSLIRENLRIVRERFVAVGALIVKDGPSICESMAGHRRIIAALREGDSMAAREAMRDHLIFGKTTLLS